VLGTKGPFTSVEFTSGGDVTAPNPPSNLSAEAGYKYITISFDLPTESDFNRVEVYESTSNNFLSALSIGFTSGNRFVRTSLGNNQTRFYWVRSQDFSGNSSAFVGPVSATTFLVSGADLTQELIDTIEAAGVEPVNSLPAQGDFDGQIVFLLTDNTLYRWDETAGVWSTELFTDIKDDSVTTDKLVASAVVASKIAAGAVTADKINVSELSAITANLGTIQVGTANIENGAVTNRFASFTAGNVNLTSSYQQVQSVVIDCDGSPVSVVFNCGVNGATTVDLDDRLDNVSQRTYRVSSGYYQDTVLGQLAVSTNASVFVSLSSGAGTAFTSGIPISGTISNTTFFYEQTTSVSLIINPAVGSRTVSVFARLNGGVSSSPIIRNRFVETTELKR
jgi:hypothetical protein